MNIPNSIGSFIPDNIQMFLSTPLPVYINTSNSEDNPLVSFEEMLQTHMIDQTAENYNEYINLAEQIGKVKLGLPEEIISGKFKIHKKTDICCICTEEKNKFLVSPCNHELCDECTSTWYKDNKKCAHCQVEIE